MLRHSTRVLMLVLAPLALGTSLRAAGPETVDEILAKHVEAMGGLKKLEAVKTMKMTGKMMFGGGMEAPMTIEFKRPNKVRIEFTFQGMTGIQAFDGKTGWIVMPFMGKTDPEKMPPDQVKEIEDQADFEGPLVNYKKKGHKVELEGKDEIEGAEVYKLKVTKKNGDVELYYLDAEYYLIVQMKGKRKFQGTEIEYEVSMGDYKEIDGLMFPHSIEPKMGGAPGGAAMTFDKIDLGVDISDERFAMPEAKKDDASAKPASGGEKKAEQDKGGKEKPGEGKDNGKH